MDKFVLHGVPISCTMEEVALSIQKSYPGTLKLAQTPRWQTTDTKRQASRKGMSIVVLAIAGQHTLQSLGYQYLHVCNSWCRLDKYSRVQKVLARFLSPRREQNGRLTATVGSESCESNTYER